MSNQQSDDLAGRWNNLGAVRGFDPGPAWRRRILLLSHAGFGKTTWISSNPRALVLDFEDGAADVANPCAHRVTIRSPEQLSKLVKELVTLAADPKRPFDVIAFDTLDTWIEWSIQCFCEAQKIVDIGDFGSHGAGYSRVRIPMFQDIDRIWHAGYGWICSGHLTRSTITVGKVERTVVEPAVSDSFRKAIFKRCQYVLYAGRVQVAGMAPKANPKTGIHYKDEDGIVKMFPTGKNNTEYRIEMSTPLSDDMKARVPLEADLVVQETGGWQVYVDAYNRAVDRLKRKETA